MAIEALDALRRVTQRVDAAAVATAAEADGLRSSSSLGDALAMAELSGRMRVYADVTQWVVEELQSIRAQLRSEGLCE